MLSGCKPQPLLQAELQLGDQPFFFFVFFSPATQGYWTCLAPLPLLSLLLRGQSLDTRQIHQKEEEEKKEKNQQDPTLQCNLPHRHKCVCVRGQGTMFAFSPGVGTLPPSACRVLRPGPFVLSGTRWMSTEKEGGS